MRIPQILLLLFSQPLKSVVPTTLLPKTVLRDQERKERDATEATEPNETQAEPEAEVISGRLILEVDVRGDDTTDVADTDLHGRTDAALVVTAKLVGKPGKNDGLGDVAATGDGEDGEIACAYRDVVHVQQDGVADCGEAAANDRESETVFQGVSKDGGGEAKDCRNDVDRD